VTHTDEDEHDHAPAPVPPKRTLKSRAGGCAKALLILVGVLVVGFFAVRWQAGRVGQRALDKQLAAIDAREPDWRLDAVMAAREKAQPPAEANDGPAILAVADALPKEWNQWHAGDDARAWFDKRDPNRVPPVESVATARAALGLIPEERAAALKLRNDRRAFFPLKIETNPIATLLPHVQKVREVVNVLGMDAQLAALDKNPKRGIEAARAQLKLARAIGDEPFFISQLVRCACATAAAQTAQQVLAWAEPTDGLAELQAELLAEAETPYFLIGMRGERAGLDRIFTGLADGTITEDEFFKIAEGQNGPGQRAVFRAYKALIPADRAYCLNLCNQYVDAAKLPHHEQLAAIRAVELPHREGFDPRRIGTRLLLPAVDRFAEAGLRTRANLLSAAACVACERFRLKHGRFPKELAELVPAFLPAVPLNPFDNKPLAFRAFEDRVAVYGWYDNGQFAREAPPADFDEGPRKGTPHGYRVWLPKSRALPHPDDEIPPPREKP
jgi:hypothetical protein